MRLWIAALPVGLGLLGAPMVGTPAQAQDLGAIIQQIAPGILGGQQQQQQYQPQYRDERRDWDDERQRRRAERQWDRQARGHDDRYERERRIVERQQRLAERQRELEAHRLLGIVAQSEELRRRFGCAFVQANSGAADFRIRRAQRC